MAIYDLNSPAATGISYGSVLNNGDRDLDKLQQERALNEATFLTINQNPHLSLINPDGSRNTPNDVAIQYLQSLAQNPNGASYTFVRSQLESNPLISQLVQMGQLPSIQDLTQQVVGRSAQLQEGRSVYNPLFNDQPLRTQVQSANSTEDTILNRLGKGIQHAFGYTGLGAIEKSKVAIDNQLSDYSKETKSGVSKILEIRQAEENLANLQAQAISTSDPREIQRIDKAMQMERDRINTLSSNLSDAEKAAVQASGQQYINDVQYRNSLKQAEAALTPRFQSTVDKETEIANLKQEYLSRGLTPSLSKLDSWHNGYARRYIGAHLDPEILFKDVAPEVVPWVAINFAVEAGAALFTRGGSLPRSALKWATYFGLGINSAAQAIDQNIDNYFEQHGTTEGFSTLKSHIMEALAFGLDMYGGKMLGEGIPTVIDNLFKMGRKQAIETAESTLDAGLRTSLATNSTEPFKAAVKTVFNACSLKSVLDFVGNKLVASGDKAAALYGRGKIRQAAGHLILGDKLAGIPLKGNGLSSLVSSTISSQASLAAENMMSETARQVGRQNGMDLERVVESGVQGIIAGPLGRAAGKALQPIPQLKQAYDNKVIASRDMISDKMLEGYENLADEYIEAENNTAKKALYNKVKEKHDNLVKVQSEEEAAKRSKDRADNVVDRYSKSLELEKAEVQDIWVDKDGHVYTEETPGTVKVKAPVINTEGKDKTDTQKNLVKKFNKDMEKEVYVKAYREVKYKEERQKQIDRLKAITNKLEKEGGLLADEEFMAGRKSTEEVEAEEAEKYKDNEVAKQTAKELRENKQFTQYKDISAEDMGILNNINPNAVLEATTKFKDRSEEEQKEMHEAIQKLDVPKINELMNGKPSAESAEKAPDEAKPAESGTESSEAAKPQETPENAEEGASKESAESKPEEFITKDALDKYKKEHENALINPEETSEHELRAADILKDSDKDVDMEQLQEDLQYLNNQEAAKLQKAAKQTIKDTKKASEDTSEVYPEEANDKEVSELAQRVYKDIQAHNKKAKGKKVKGSKKVSELSEEDKARANIEKVTVTNAEGREEEEEVITSLKENKYEHLKTLAENKGDFWNNSKVTEAEQTALLNKATERAKKGSKLSQAKTLDEFVTEYNKTKPVKSVSEYLADMAKNLYAEEQQAIDKLSKSNVRTVDNVHGYRGQTEKEVIRHYVRMMREGQTPYKKEMEKKAKDYDAWFLFDKNLYNDEDYLNFVVYVSKTEILKNALDSVENMQKLWEQDVENEAKQDQKLANVKKRRETKIKHLIDLLNPLLNRCNTGYYISARKRIQLDLLIASLEQRANSGNGQNFKALSSYLNAISDGISYLIKEGRITESVDQGPGLWTGSSKYQAQQDNASEKSREYRQKFSTGKDLLDSEFYLSALLNTIDPNMERRSENYSQSFGIEDIADLGRAIGESNDVDTALKTWVNSHSLDTDKAVLNLVEGKIKDIFTELEQFWNKDTRVNIKKSGNFIKLLLENTRDKDVQNFFRFNEGKSADTGYADFWVEKWNAASPSLKQRIAEAFLSNPVTLAAALGIKSDKHGNGLNNTNLGRVKQDLFKQLNSDKVNTLKLGSDSHFKAYIYLKLRDANLIDSVTFFNLIRDQFYQDLQTKLKRVITPQNAYYARPIESLTWYVANEYSVSYMVDFDALNQAIDQNKLTDEEKAKYKTWKSELESWEQLHNDAFAEHDGIVWKAFVDGGGKFGEKTADMHLHSTPPTRGIYKGKTWSEVKEQWYKSNPRPELDSGIETKLNIRKDVKTNKEASQYWVDQNNYVKPVYRKKGEKNWNFAADRYTDKITVDGKVIASQAESDLADLGSDKLLEQLLDHIWDSTLSDLEKLPATENKKDLRPNILPGTLNAEQYSLSFLNSHWGELVVYKWLQKQQQQSSKHDDDFRKKFSNVFSYLNVKFPAYNAHRNVTVDNVTDKDLDKLIDVIQNTDSSNKPSKAAIEKLAKQYTTSEADIENVVNVYFTNDTLSNTLNGETTEAQRTVLAKALQAYINLHDKIYNSVSRNKSTFSFTADRVDTLDAKSHARNNLPKGYFKAKSRKSILLHEDGFANALAQNSDLINEKAFQVMLKAAESLYGRVTIPVDELFAQAECDNAGRVLQHVIDIAVAAGVSAYARTSSETSDDFLNQLRVTAPGAWRVYSDPDSHIIDQDNFIESVGKMAANVLGYKPNSAAYKLAVARLGQIAVLGLEASKVGLERVYIHRATGQLVSVTGDKSNCIPAIRIAKPDIQSELNDSIKCTNADGSVGNWVDKMLDVDFHFDDSLHTKEGRMRQDILKFMDERKIEGATDYAAETDWFNENGTLKVETVKEVTKDIPAYKFNNQDIAKVVKLENMAMVCLLDSSGQIDANKIIVFSHDALIKTDFTQVSDRKLATLAAQMVQGVDVDMEEFFKTFTAMGILEKDGNNYKFAKGLTPEEVANWDLDHLDNFLKDHPFAAMMLHTNSKYGMDPAKKSGRQWLNTRITNLYDFQKMVKDAAAFQNIDGVNHFQRQGKPAYLNLHFSELNTVNNRLFVKSSVFNYREFKHWRSIVSLNKVRDQIIKLETVDQKAMFAAPILFNLGFDVDKISNSKAILDIWDKLAKTQEFAELLSVVADKDKGYKDILDAIEAYNKKMPKKSELNDANSYVSFKGDPTPKNFKISANFEAVTCLSKLNKIQQVEDNGKGTITYTSILSATSQDSAAISIRGYDITIEVDGLTNGPSFKNIGSPLISNTDHFSHLLLGATGASDHLFNIRTAYEGGIRDTYNLNGDFVKERLIRDAVKEYFMGFNETSAVMKYLNALYKPTVSDEGQSPLHLDSLIDVMTEVFTRDFMKPPTMVIGYEAGKLSVIETLLNELDTRFSMDCAESKNEELGEWYQAVKMLTGKDSITLEYIDGTAMEHVTLDSKGVHLPFPIGTKPIAELSPDDLKRISFSHTEMPELRTHIADLFGRMYDSIAASKELFQGPYQQLGNCAQSLANAFDVVVRNAIDSEIGTDGITAAEYVKTVDRIIADVDRDINAVINVGIEGKGDKSLLSLTKEEITDCVIKAMGVYTTAGEGRFIKSTVALAGRTSLGAGVVPMFIHSYDSSVVHVMLQKVMDAADERILTIHDAALLNLTQLAGKWKTQHEEAAAYDSEGNVSAKKLVDDTEEKEVNGVYYMNQGHYESGHEQLRSFADICKHIHNAINALEAKRAKYKIAPDALTGVLNDLRSAEEDMFKTTVSLLSQRKAFYNREKALADAGDTEKMWHDYQYSAFGADASTAANKEALGGFVPTSEQLTDYLNAVDGIMNSLKFPVALASIKHKIAAALKEHLSKEQQDNVFNTHGEIADTGLARLTDLTSFYNWLKDVTDISDPVMNQIKSAVSSVMTEAAAKDPEVSLRRNLIDSLKKSEDQTGTNDRTSENSVIGFLQKAFKLIGDRSKEFGKDAPTRLLLTNDNATLHTRAIQAIYAMSKLPPHLRDSQIGQLMAFREMTQLNKESAEQQEAFERLVSPFYKSAITLSEYDSSKDTTVVYSDTFDFAALEEVFEKSVNKQHFVNQRSFTYYEALSKWFGGDLKENHYAKNSLKADMDELCKRSKEGQQFVFTLRSNGDIFRMLALQDVITNKYADKSFTIAIVPAVSNLTGKSPIVNEEVAVYQKLHNDNSKLHAEYYTGTVHSHNYDLHQTVQGFNATRVTEETGVVTEANGHMMVMNGDYTVAERVTTSSLGGRSMYVHRRDERNNPIQGGYVSSVVSSFDFVNSPINGRGNYSFNVRIPFRDFKPSQHVTNVSVKDLISQNEAIDASKSFDEILGNDNSTVIVQTEASGEILHDGLAAYAGVEGSILNRAYQKYQEKLAEKQQSYVDLNHTDYAWKIFMSPVAIPVTNHMKETKVFVFLPVVDNSVTVKELKDGIVQVNTSFNNKIPQIRVGSELSQRLKYTDDAETAKTLDALREKYKDKGDNYRIAIPKKFMSPDLLWENSPFNPDWLQVNNAAYLREIFTNNPQMFTQRIRIPVSSLAPYQSESNAGRTMFLPKTPNDVYRNNLTYVDLSKVPLHKYRDFHLTQMQIQREQVEDQMGKVVQKFVVSPLEKAHSYTGKIIRKIPGVTKLEAKFAHGYVGTVSDLPADYAYRISDEFLMYDQAGHKFRQLMLRSIARDKAKGLNTSLVERNLDMMENLVTLAQVRINQTKGIQSSQQAVLLAGEIGEREFLNIGTTGTYESEAEAFMHEMLHTLWRHLNAYDPALRKKLSDMFNYVSANFNINHFADGATLKNQQIMDAVFSKDTVDNVEEFLCYYLTNQAFHDAVNNMANQKGTNLSNVLESNTRGIFRKLLATAQNFLKGKFTGEKDPETIEELAQKALSVALNYNNKYWSRKQNLIESATKEEISTAMVLGLKEPAYKVIDKLYDDSVFTLAVKAAVQQLYKAFGFGDKQAALVSSNIGGTEEFNRITETGAQLSDNLIEAKRKYLNAEDNFVNDLLSSLEGVSRSQYDYLVLRTKSKTVIDQQREQMGAAVNEAVRTILKDVPEKIAKHLTMQFIHTDMSCLFRNTQLNLEQIKKVLTDKKTRDAHIAELERTLASDRYATYYKNAAKGLAQYLVTGFNPTGLNYRNAYEIISRIGSQTPVNVQLGSALHNAVDQLISLYTIDLLDTSKVNTFKEVPIETLHKLANIHNAVKDADNSEVYMGNSAMHLHVPKGELHGGTTYNRYEIIPAEELEAYEWNGYKKVSDAELDPFFKSHTTGKYVMVRAAYKSPAVTTAGIFTMTNIFKGRTQTGINIGSVLGKSIDKQTSVQFGRSQEFADLQKYIQARIENLNTANPAMIQTPTSGNMQLTFNVANHLAGAVFEVNPIEQFKQTGKEIKVTSVLGDLYGSCIERTLTPERNKAIAQSVIDIYESATDKENFVWIAPNSKNEKYRDLYDFLPIEVKEIMNEKYGEQGMPVRLKALNTVFGYRNLSANDTKKFIEEERKAQANANQLSYQFTKNIRNIFYNGYLGNAETFVRWLARVGKTQVVIKGITTSWFNVLSNCVLLSMNGLSAKQVLEYQLDGLRQFDMLRQYKYQLRQLKQKQLLGQYTDADARAEASINKSIKSLPVYDLIENGVIANTIAEDRNESEALVQNIIKSVFPKGIAQTVANNLAITPNSYLYQVLADFASLGDIGGKWALYRYNTERKMDKKEAARLSLNAFIDYSNPLPKQLQLVDDFAVLPFMKYALGIQNMLIRTISKHPDRTLAWVLGINSLIGVAHPFQSLLSPQSVYDRMQLPGELFADSFGSLPSNRLLNWYGEVNP